MWKQWELNDQASIDVSEARAGGGGGGGGGKGVSYTGILRAVYNDYVSYGME